MTPSSPKPVLALLLGGALWGIVWYPYRLLHHAGLDGIWSTGITFAIALGLGALLFPREILRLPVIPPLAWLMALAIGASNLAYVLAVLEGEVLRVLLLFYLAPLWTVPLARLLLGERLDRTAAFAMSLALLGAAVMLWRPDLGAPWPHTRSEWLAVAAGLFFALGNVLVRKLDTMSDASKSLAIWAGVAFAAFACLPWSRVDASAAAAAAAAQWTVVAGTGAALVSMGMVLQYGLSRIPANRAVVILLVELPIAALAAWILAGELPRAQDGLGGALIVAAMLLAARRR